MAHVADDAGGSEVSDVAASVVSDGDLAACLRVLHALADDDGVGAEFHTPRFKPLRQAMQLYLDDVRGKLFNGKGADKYKMRKERQRQETARIQQERALDRAQADKTQMRARDKETSLVLSAGPVRCGVVSRSCEIRYADIPLFFACILS